MADTWLILPYENLFGKLQDKESNRKYYFTDNGLLHLFLVDADTSLLENIIAVTLRRKYGDGSYFWNSRNAEVDFVIPEENWPYRFPTLWQIPILSGGRQMG